MSSSSSAAAAASSRPPKLHMLQLHESPIRNGDNYERFDWQWILVNDDNRSDYHGITLGDVICIPSLMSGAGEFEGVRFVGTPTEDTGGLPLYKAGIEYPEFPSVIAQQNDNLRLKYEDVFDAMLREAHGGMTLSDLMGGDDVVEEFWASPYVARRRGPPVTQEWLIPLSQCTVTTIENEEATDA